MKFILCLIFLGFSFATWSQKPRDDSNVTFQVIFAENVQNTQGKKISSLDIISVDEMLTIGQSGFLAMINCYGYPIEIRGDTIISMLDIQMPFELLQENKTKRNNYLREADIRFLFIKDRELAQKSRLELGGACSDCDFDLELIYPPKFNYRDIFFTGDLCISWHPTRSNNYKIKLTDLFDEPVETYISTTNELRIDSAEMASLINGNEKGLVLYISDGEKEQMSGVIRQFPSLVLKNPYSCAPAKATYALMMAINLETGPRDFPKSAGMYYKLAAALSDNKFFKTMLENYNKRQQ
jgi:hypothetical protein